MATALSDEAETNPQRDARRVLMVSNFLSSRGTSRGACEELARHLSRAGFSVITTSTKTNKLARLADMIRTAWRHRKKYDVAQIDVYSGSAFVWAEAVGRLLKWMGKPFVLSLHGGGLPDFSRRWPRRVNRLLSDSSAVTTPSEYLRASMADYRSDIRVIPNSIAIENYAYRCRERPSPNLIWLRSIHEIYNPVQAVDVLAALRADYPDANLKMVGPDKGDGSLEQVKERAEKLGVQDSLTITGVVEKSKVPDHLQTADIFLNTSDVDNTPISVIEAMACGLCVVSTDVGGIPYLVQHERDGLLVRPRDTEAMVSAVRRVLVDSPLAASLSESARRRTEQFDWSVTLTAWRSVLSDAVSHHPFKQETS